MTKFDPDKFLTPRQIKNLTSMPNIEVCWDWLRTAKIKAYKIGQNYLVPKDEFMAWWKDYEPTFRKFQEVARKRKAAQK